MPVTISDNPMLPVACSRGCRVVTARTTLFHDVYFFARRGTWALCYDSSTGAFRYEVLCHTLFLPVPQPNFRMHAEPAG